MPPIVAIALALLTKEVYLSIVCGVCPWRTVDGRIPPVDCV